MAMQIIGEQTHVAPIFKNESGKLAHSFPVKTGKTVIAGQPVVLNTDGTIQGYASADDVNKIIGIAVGNSANPAYKASKQFGDVEVTVFVNGFAIIWGVAAADGQLAGPVVPTGSLDDTSRYVEYEELASNEELDIDVNVAVSTAVTLTPTTGEGGVWTGCTASAVSTPTVTGSPTVSVIEQKFIALSGGDEGELIQVLVR